MPAEWHKSSFWIDDMSRPAKPTAWRCVGLVNAESKEKTEPRESLLNDSATCEEPPIDLEELEGAEPMAKSIRDWLKSLCLLGRSRLNPVSLPNSDTLLDTVLDATLETLVMVEVDDEVPAITALDVTEDPPPGEEMPLYDCLRDGDIEIEGRRPLP